MPPGKFISLMGRRHRKIPAKPVMVKIESLSHEGRGIGHIDNKTVFVDGALPGETVMFQYRRRKSGFDEGKTIEVIHASPDRILPECEHYDVCGGCSLQHMPSIMQLAHKQQVLLEQLQHMGGTVPEEILPPVTGPVWRYRRKARLAVKYVEKKHKVLVGFREKYSSFVAEISRCIVLHPAVGEILSELQKLVCSISIYRRIPQIEIAVAENKTALVFRHLADFTPEDVNLMRCFADEHDVQIYLQPYGPDSIQPLDPGRYEDLKYSFATYGLEFVFLPTDFTQINYEMNVKMVDLVLSLLSPGDNDHVLDLFCGLGNFTLAISQQGSLVTAVDGDEGLVARARYNARINKLLNIDFHVANLGDEDISNEFIRQSYTKILLDPPRSGAREVINQLDFDGVVKIVYVSCNPSTLARDADILVNEKGFRLVKTGIMDMFPHTTHVESMALFEKQG